MAQLIGRSVVCLHIKKPLEITHVDSLTCAAPCCRIDQFGVTGGMVVGEGGVVVLGGRVVVTPGRVVVTPGRVVVVVDGRVVVVVEDVAAGSSTAVEPPFKIPRGSPAPDAGLLARLGGAQVGHSTRFCFVSSTTA
jgi:hypothetical protein